MKTAIIDLCSDTPVLKLRLGTRGCDGRHVMTEDAEIVFTQVVCQDTFYPVREQLPIDMCNGCPPVQMPPDPVHKAIHPVVIRYPALGVDNDGLIEFYFDDKLFSSPPGRYKASVLVGGCEIRTLDINLCCTPIEIEQIEVSTARTCDESC
jgi:hypothetical protein